MNVAITSRRCLECGAIPRESDSKFCSYCGAELPTLDRPAPETPAETTARRFEQLQEHPDARRALASKPSGRGVMAKRGGSAAGNLLALGAVGLFVIFWMRASSSMMSTVVSPVSFRSGPGSGFEGGVRMIFTLVPLVILGGVIYQAVRVFGSSAKVAQSPVRSQLALVVDEHLEDRGRGEHRRSVHVATRRRERRALELRGLQGHRAQSRPGRHGCAASKGPAIVRFDRVDV